MIIHPPAVRHNTTESKRKKGKATLPVAVERIREGTPVARDGNSRGVLEALEPGERGREVGDGPVALDGGLRQRRALVVAVGEEDVAERQQHLLEAGE